MGQKTNKQTLYKNLVTEHFYLNKFFVKQYLINKNLAKLFLLKGSLLLQFNLTFSINKVIILYSYYIFSRKISFFKRLGINSLFNKVKLQTNIFEQLLKNKLKFFRVNFIIYKFSCLNNKINKIHLTFVYSIFKKYLNFLFVKKFNLFIDFLKILILFNNYTANLELQSFIYILGMIFKNLHKKIHSKFFVFLNSVIKFLIQNKFFKNILGIKFKVSGKLKGKPIASTFVCIKGKISTQTFINNVKYVQEDIFTKYGVFGFKFWIRYK